MTIDRNQWIWGLSLGAETWNGRLAMISFLFIFIFEIYTSCSILSILGIY